MRFEWKNDSLKEKAYAEHLYSTQKRLVQFTVSSSCVQWVLKYIHVTHLAGHQSLLIPVAPQRAQAWNAIVQHEHGHA